MCEFLFFHAGLCSARNWLLGASSLSLQQPRIDPPAPLYAPQTRTRSLFAPNEKKISLVIYLKVHPLALGVCCRLQSIFSSGIFALLQIGAANYPQLIGFDTSHFCANIKHQSRLISRTRFCLPFSCWLLADAANLWEIPSLQTLPFEYVIIFSTLISSLTSLGFDWHHWKSARSLTLSIQVIHFALLNTICLLLLKFRAKIMIWDSDGMNFLSTKVT